MGEVQEQAYIREYNKIRGLYNYYMGFNNNELMDFYVDMLTGMSLALQCFGYRAIKDSRGYIDCITEVIE